MIIETVLDLKPEMMAGADDAMAVLKEVWEERKQPTEAQSLITVLKITMDRCNRNGIHYPRIFLLRKAELMRGEFQPRQELRFVADPAKVKFASVTHPLIPQEWINRAAQESAKLANEKFATYHQKRALRQAAANKAHFRA